MCGRYLFMESPQIVAEAFELSAVPDIVPRYNVAPSQVVAVVGLRADGTSRGLVPMRWGFVPNWANDPNTGPRPINARAESAASKQPFKEAFRRRRCLIPASGFYEWKAEGKRKLPHLFRPKVPPIAFAGLWDVWGTGTGRLFTCAILTVRANDAVKPYHDRMPAILTRDQFAPWLDPTMSVPNLESLLAPFPADAIEVIAVGMAVNSPKNDSAECVQPVGGPAA